MKRIKIGGCVFEASQIALGCMRISALTPQAAEKLIKTALDEGIDFFDHADIYGGGRSESVFAQAARFSSSQREKVRLQTKCGIRKGYFDFSRDHILESVDGSLKRLQTDYIDVLLLHRPDALVEPEDVAEAFDRLHSQGKVRHFGISNQNPMQIELLNKHVRQPLIINQLQLSLTNTGMIDAGLNVNMEIDPSVNRDGSILDYCRLHDITIQPWSPLQFGFFDGVFLNNDKFPDLNRKIAELGEHYQVSDAAVAIAWLMRHPAGMQPIIGTTNPDRVKDICQAARVDMTRQEWYALYLSVGNKLP
jgi:predicted oxidoreductase